MDERVSGFRITGDWGEVVEHGERVSRALDEAGAGGEACEAWEDWRPKTNELLDSDIREKTATHASVKEGAGERAGESPNEDLRTAGEKLTESYERLEDNETEAAVERWQDSLNYVARAADSAGRKALRSVEDTVYRRVMTQVAPYYFDNELVSATIGRSRDNGAPFVFEVNVNDDELKAAVAARLEALEEVKRWHVATEKDIASAEAAEGVETPPEAADPDRSLTLDE